MKKVLIGYNESGLPQAFAIVTNSSELVRNAIEFVQDRLRVVLCSLEKAKKIWK